MKKIIKYLLVLMLFIATPVFASTTDLFKADKNVVVQEDFDGSGFVAGQTVDIDNNVNGILFTAGDNVDISSKSEYLFAAGNVLKIDEVSFTDGFIAGNSISLMSGNVKRDIYVAGQTIDFNAIVGRNANLAGGTVKFDGKVEGDLTIAASKIVIGNNAEVKGTLKYSEESEIEISDSAKIGNTVKEKSVDIEINPSKSSVFVGRLYSTLVSIANLVLLGVILLLFMPKIFEKIAKLKKETILNNLGIGFVSLVFIPIAAIILMFTLVGLSVGLISLILYFIFAYLSTIVSGYYFSNMILSKKIKNKYALLIIGICAIKVIGLIPFIGFLVGLVSLCIGLGIIINLLFKRK